MADELLTVAEAAARLGVSIPRLRRWLARPENASFGFSMQRMTRTGMRTALVVPVSILPDVERQIKQERERKHMNMSSRSVDMDNSYIDSLINEKDARIAELTEALKYEREQHHKSFWFWWFRRT